MPIEPSTGVFSLADLNAMTQAPERMQLELGPLLGSGGAGIVYRARDAALRRDVALKVLLSGAPDAVQRFQMEAQILAQLSHPYIVPVYRSGIDGQDRQCFAMKLVEGQTLSDKLAGVQHMSLAARLRFALPVLVKVCDAVAYAHNRGVLHCDLKPENIMVGAFGEVTVMDWGIARVLDRPDRPDTVVVEAAPVMQRAGTLDYMAPEQGLDPAGIDERVDVFGLGGVLHFIILGRPPRAARDVADLLHDVALPDAATLMLPRPLLHLCASALQRDRGQRPRSVAEFQRELESTLEERSAVDVREVPAGAHVLNEGDLATEAFVIVRGTCEVFRDIGGERQVLRQMGPGEVFGEAAVLDGGTRTASVRAVDRVELVVVPAEEILGNIGARSFVTSLAKRFRELEARAAAAEAKLKD